MELLLGPRASIAFLCFGDRDSLGNLLLTFFCLEADEDFGTGEVFGSAVLPTFLVALVTEILAQMGH